MLRVTVFSILLLLLSCAKKNLAQPANSVPDKEVQTESDDTATETSDSDNELMSLLDANETTSNFGNDSSEIEKTENVSYESINQSSPTSEKTVATTPSLAKKTLPDENIEKLKAEISNLKQGLSQKDLAIQSLKSENNALKNTKTSPQVVYQPQGEVLDNETYKLRYNDAYQLFLTKSYTEAINMFENLIANDASNSLADNAQYWIGESYFGLRKYKDAALAFEKVFTFKKSNKEEDAQFKLGYCYYLLKDNLNAKLELQRFLSKFPSSRNVERARNLLASL
jgi:TolA-binding protein